MSKLKIFSKAILVPVVIGFIVGLIISNYMDYSSLSKPLLAPPSIVFPIVWTILYILMGISYGIIDYEGKIDSEINIIYYPQLFVNLLWSIIFFVLKWRLLSFLWIILLIVLVCIMIFKFYKRNKVASLIQIPYLLWIIFASYLNISFYLLNM